MDVYIQMLITCICVITTFYEEENYCFSKWKSKDMWLFDWVLILRVVQNSCG